jgi:lipoprotein-anchoring transpeptidase ErfK/SrfK
MSSAPLLPLIADLFFATLRVSSRNPKGSQHMTSRCANPKPRQRALRPAHLVIAGLAVLVVAGDRAVAKNSRTEIPVESVQSRAAGEPIMAIVSLRDQRITIYDAAGWILKAPVSSGQKGRETPAGIFSVIQKEEEHYSNLYDDAYMPHMQRITWSGIALHGGPLPGYPASHGCIRMPYDFAARLFDLTRMGMRVIVAPTEVAPTEIVHPALFAPKPDGAALAAARATEADEAAKKAAQARLIAVTASREAAAATKTVRVAENLKLRAEAQLAAAEKALASASSPDQKERPRSRNCRRNGPPPRPSCRPRSIPPRLRVKPPSPQKPLGWLQPTRRANSRVRSNPFRCLSAARLSASMSGGAFSPSWTLRSPSWNPNDPSERMSSPPWSGSTVTTRCDGASSH